MNVSRRSFLGGALAIALASSASASLPLSTTPIIYGDGFHDDTAGLQAAIDGKPFRVFGHHHAVVAGKGSVAISGGSFLISRRLVLRDVTITGGSFVATPDFTDRCMFEVHGRTTLIGMYLDGRNMDDVDRYAILYEPVAGTYSLAAKQPSLIRHKGAA